MTALRGKVVLVVEAAEALLISSAFPNCPMVVTGECAFPAPFLVAQADLAVLVIAGYQPVVR